MMACEGQAREHKNNASSTVIFGENVVEKCGENSPEVNFPN